MFKFSMLLTFKDIRNSYKYVEPFFVVLLTIRPEKQHYNFNQITMVSHIAKLCQTSIIISMS